MDTLPIEPGPNTRTLFGYYLKVKNYLFVKLSTDRRCVYCGKRLRKNRCCYRFYMYLYEPIKTTGQEVLLWKSYYFYSENPTAYYYVCKPCFQTTQQLERVYQGLKEFVALSSRTRVSQVTRRYTRLQHQILRIPTLRNVIRLKLLEVLTTQYTRFLEQKLMTSLDSLHKPFLNLSHLYELGPLYSLAQQFGQSVTRCVFCQTSPLATQPTPGRTYLLCQSCYPHLKERLHCEQKIRHFYQRYFKPPSIRTVPLPTLRKHVQTYKRKLQASPLPARYKDFYLLLMDVFNWSTLPFTETLLQTLHAQKTRSLSSTKNSPTNSDFSKTFFRNGANYFNEHLSDLLTIANAIQTLEHTYPHLSLQHLSRLLSAIKTTFFPTQPQLQSSVFPELYLLFEEYCAHRAVYQQLLKTQLHEQIEAIKNNPNSYWKVTHATTVLQLLTHPQINLILTPAAQTALLQALKTINYYSKRMRLGKTHLSIPIPDALQS